MQATSSVLPASTVWLSPKPMHVDVVGDPQDDVMDVDALLDNSSEFLLLTPMTVEQYFDTLQMSLQVVIG